MIGNESWVGSVGLLRLHAGIVGQSRGRVTLIRMIA